MPNSRPSMRNLPPSKAAMKNLASRLKVLKAQLAKDEAAEKQPHQVVYGIRPEDIHEVGLGDKGLGDPYDHQSRGRRTSRPRILRPQRFQRHRLSRQDSAHPRDQDRRFSQDRLHPRESPHLRSDLPRSGFTKKQRKRGAKSPLFFLPPFGFQNKDYTTF
jgi:hypothetical protein